MLRPRITPCLLIHDGGLVKTTAFDAPKYVGDPINAVKIFNEKEADELIVLDIDATMNGAEPNYDVIANLAAECRMPLAYGGGIRTADQASRIVSLGVEKVAISSAAVERPELISEIANEIGRQSVVVVVDVARARAGGYELRTHNAKRRHAADPVDFANRAAILGAGEIVVNSIDLDGAMTGYDLALAKHVRNAIDVPMTILGGAGSLADMKRAIEQLGLIGVAAGSLFVFKGSFRAVLINYPAFDQKDRLVRDAMGLS